MTTTFSPRLLASTALGDVVECDGVVYLLTQCCKASAKGSGSVASGVMCRACHAELDESAGWGALAADEDGSGQAQLAALLRPSVEQFAEQVARLVFESAKGKG